MRRRVNVYHYLLAVHGLALLRRWLAPAAPAENDTEAAAAEPGTERHRLHAATPGDHESRPGADEHLGASRWLRPTAAIDEDALLASAARLLGSSRRHSAEVELPELDLEAGYEEWALSYDQHSPVLEPEEAVIRELVPPRDGQLALDAACGSGRHSRLLAERGYRVVGVDQSPAMLERARANAPNGRFLLGALEAIPLPDAFVDLGVCALALIHVPDLLPPLRELQRVLRPGGRLLISDLHPFLVLLGGQAFFRLADGSRAFVRNLHHSHADYVAAFAAAGLEVRSCAEPEWPYPSYVNLYPPGGPAELEEQGILDAAGTGAFGGMPGMLIWELAKGT